MCFQAYSSLGMGELVTDPVVMGVAKNCERTPGQVITNASHLDKCLLIYSLKTCLPSVLQVLLRWAVQQGIPVLPKSSNPDRIKENSKVFDFTLTDTAMARLSALDCGHKYCWDPSQVA